MNLERQLRYHRSVNTLNKWRKVFTRRILGPNPSNKHIEEGYNDIFSKLLVLRSECSSLTRLLIEKGVCTEEEAMETFAEEADELCKLLEKEFPGFYAKEYGLVMNPLTAETTKEWPK